MKTALPGGATPQYEPVCGYYQESGAGPTETM